MKNFIGQAVLDIMRRQQAPECKEVHIYVYDFASSSKELWKRFNVVSNQIVNHRKMTERNTFFSMLRYDSIYGRPSSTEEHNTQGDQMWGAYQKPDVVDASGENDTSRYILADFSEICAERVKRTGGERRTATGAYNVFHNQETCLKLMKFRKYGIGESDYICFLSSIRVNAIITDDVDALQLDLEPIIITCGTGSTYSADEEVAESAGRPALNMESTKGVKKPQDYVL